MIDYQPLMIDSQSLMSMDPNRSFSENFAIDIEGEDSRYN